MERRYLEPDEMVLVLPREHPVASGDAPIPMPALATIPWATARPGTAYADMFTRICRSVGGFESDVRHRAGEMRLLLELVGA